MLRTLALASATAAALVSSSLLSTAAHASTTVVTPPGFTISLVSANGSGCPTGSAQVTVSPDHTAFTVTYSNYLAQVGVGALPTDFRKNCQLSVQVNAPQGFTYAVAEADYRGFGYLANGALGTERANYYFQGQSQTASITHTFNGPLNDDWEATDQTGVAALVWSPCGEGRDLNINTQLMVNAGTSNPATTTSFMTMDSTDGSLTTIYHLSWETCPQ